MSPVTDVSSIVSCWVSSTVSSSTMCLCLSSLHAQCNACHSLKTSVLPNAQHRAARAAVPDVFRTRPGHASRTRRALVKRIGHHSVPQLVIRHREVNVSSPCTKVHVVEGIGTGWRFGLACSSVATSPPELTAQAVTASRHRAELPASVAVPMHRRCVSALLLRG